MLLTLWVRFQNLISPAQAAGEVESRDAVAERARVLAEAALTEGARLNDATLQRSAAEMFALAACIGSDANALRLVQNLCTTMASTASPPRCASLAHIKFLPAYCSASSQPPAFLVIDHVILKPQAHFSASVRNQCKLQCSY